MIEIPKSKITATLLTIATYDRDTQKMTSGLLTERVQLSVKRKLQKIRTILLKSETELREDITEIANKVIEEAKKSLPENIDFKDCQKEGSEEAKKWDKLVKIVNQELSTKVKNNKGEEIPLENRDFRREEIETLLEETIKIEADRISIKMVEDIETKENYDWEIIQMIGE